MPLTDIAVPEGGLRSGAEVVAWTRLGPLAAADRMLVTPWSRAGGCGWSRRGRLLHGWAEITVDRRPGDGAQGRLVSWTEELWLPGLHRAHPAGRRPARPRAVLPRRRRAAGRRGRRQRGRPSRGGDEERAVSWAVVLALLGSPSSWRWPGCSGAPDRSEHLVGPQGSRMPTRRPSPPVTVRRPPASPRSCAATGWTRSTPCSTRSRAGSPRTTGRSPGCVARSCPSPPPPRRPGRPPGPRLPAWPCAPTGQRQRRGRTSRPLDRVRQPALTTPRLPDVPAPAAAPVGPLGAAGLPPLGRLGPLRAARLTAHRLPLAGRPGPAGVRVVLRGRGAQPDQPGQPPVQRPAELP